MKILAINNYSLKGCLRQGATYESPMHHCWGVDRLIDEGHEVDMVLYSNGKGKFHWICNLILFNLSMIWKCRKYDLVIAYANPIIGMLSAFKACGFLKCKMSLLVHHFGKHAQLTRGYENIFFLSDKIKKKYEILYPKLKHNFKVLHWGPDLNYYKQITPPYLQPIEYQFITTGKTYRDLTMMTEVMSTINATYIVISDREININGNVVKNGIEDINSLTYNETIDYLRRSQISVIPVNTTLPSGCICGLTSLLDAIALGQPVLMSDNTNIDIDIEKEGFGLYYKAGDKEDFTNKAKFLMENPTELARMAIKAKNFSLKFNYEIYCKELIGSLKL